MTDGFDRRGFLQAGGAGAAALLCTIGGRRIEVRTPEDVDEVDAAMAKLRRPAAAADTRPNAGRDPIDRARFPQPTPGPGGREREYWIAARTVTWNYAPTGRDEWLKMPIRGRRTFRAYCYQPYSAGFGRPLAPPSMPGPTIHAEVGDLIRVHFRNADTRLRQAVTMHPHGVRYNPDYDGAYLGDFTRAGGFVAPGEEFTYLWEATPDSVGVWPYHDHGPNHTLNTFRGLFGTIVVRPRGTPAPTREYVLYMHSFPFQITRIPRLIHAINGRAFAGNTPTLRAKVGDEVAVHVIGGDNNLHTFHVHGHRWRSEATGNFTDNPILGPHETITARWTEDNPGRWLYHCHVFDHQDHGMAGWYLVDR